VAARHYLQTTDQHFQRAIGEAAGAGEKRSEKAQRKAQQLGAELSRIGSQAPRRIPVFAGENQLVLNSTVLNLSSFRS
jgi:hypothetical protein